MRSADGGVTMTTGRSRGFSLAVDVLGVGGHRFQRLGEGRHIDRAFVEVDMVVARRPTLEREEPREGGPFLRRQIEFRARPFGFSAAPTPRATTIRAPRRYCRSRPVDSAMSEHTRAVGVVRLKAPKRRVLPSNGASAWPGGRARDGSPRARAPCRRGRASDGRARAPGACAASPTWSPSTWRAARARPPGH